MGEFDATDFPTPMIYLQAVAGHGQSYVSVQTFTQSNSECFSGTFANASGSYFTTPTTPAACGFLQIHGIVSCLTGPAEPLICTLTVPSFLAPHTPDR